MKALILMIYYMHTIMNDPFIKTATLCTQNLRTFRLSPSLLLGGCPLHTNLVIPLLVVVSILFTVLLVRNYIQEGPGRSLKKIFSKSIGQE